MHKKESLIRREIRHGVTLYKRQSSWAVAEDGCHSSHDQNKFLAVQLGPRFILRIYNIIFVLRVHDIFVICLIGRLNY